MSTRILYSLVTATILLLSCGQSTDINSGGKSKLNFIKRPADDSLLILGVAFLDNNKEFSKLGFSNERPTWADCFIRSDSLVVYLPTGKFQNACLFIGFDSARAVNAIKPDHKICDLRHSCIIKMTPMIYKKYDTLIGAVKCWDSLKNSFAYYPFVRHLK